MTATSGLLSADEVTRATTRAAAEDCVRNAYPGGAEVVIEWDEFPALDGLEGRQMDIRPRLMRRPDAQGALPLSIEFWDNGRRVNQVAASARVQVLRHVLVAARTLDRNSVVGPDDFSIEKRDVREIGGGFFLSAEGVTGKRTRRVVPEGEILLARDIEDIPVIERGEKVRVIVTLGAITVSASALALEDGAEGQIISVKNDRSGKRLQGVVVAKGIVRVELAGVL